MKVKKNILLLMMIVLVSGTVFADDYTDWQKELSVATSSELFVLTNLVGEKQFTKEEPNYIVIRDVLAEELGHRVNVVDSETEEGQLLNAALVKITVIEVCDVLAVITKNLDQEIQEILKE